MGYKFFIPSPSILERFKSFEVFISEFHDVFYSSRLFYIIRTSCFIFRPLSLPRLLLPYITSETDLGSLLKIHPDSKSKGKTFLVGSRNEDRDDFTINTFKRSIWTELLLGERLTSVTGTSPVDTSWES